MDEISRFLQLYDRESAETKDLEDRVYYRATRTKFPAILERLLRVQPRKILEIGSCRFSRQLKTLYPEWEIHTLDLTERLRPLSEEAGLVFHLGDVLQPLQCPQGYFDAIIFSEVIEHLQGNPRQALRHLRACLAPKGSLIVTTPNLVRLSSRLRFAFGQSPLEYIGAPGAWGGHIREFTLPELTSYFEREGYRVTEAVHSMHWDTLAHQLTSGVRGFDEKTGEFYYRPRFAGLKKPLGYLIGGAINLLARNFPSLRQALIVVAESA